VNPNCSCWSSLPFRRCFVVCGEALCDGRPKVGSIVIDWLSYIAKSEGLPRQILAYTLSGR